MNDYKPGDVANGHVLMPDGTWMPVTAPAAKPRMATWKIVGIIAAAVLIVGAVIPRDGGTTTVTEDVSASESLTPEVETEEEVYAPSAADTEDEYIFDVENFYPNWRAYGSRAEALSIGYTTCGLLDDFTVADSMAIIEQSANASGIPMDLAATLTSSAVVNLCPQHRGAVEQWASEGGDSTVY
jgi:hypothetical protein